MTQEEKNKNFVLTYFQAISGKEKTAELNELYMSDQQLKEHIVFFDSIFPNYEIYADEMIAEGNKVMVRARVKGVHMGELNGIPPTHKTVEFPFAITYTIVNEMIIDHWMISDQVELMQQLGVMETSNAH